MRERIAEGHIFRKLNEKGKVFIEYAPLEKAWVPIVGDNYFYIYCLWVMGSYKGKGYGKSLMDYCLADAKAKGKSGYFSDYSEAVKIEKASDRIILRHFEVRKSYAAHGTGEYTLSYHEDYRAVFQEKFHFYYPVYSCFCLLYTSPSPRDCS